MDNLDNLMIISIYLNYLSLSSLLDISGIALHIGKVFNWC